ncbi:MAG: helix-turn-helix transcriptional regulator [Lachnospiraceae bacterium]|nr:helix-turn-helix transcriptional regulator [Lachnospiraceae bacterium]
MLRSLLEEKRISQYRLAKMTGLPQSTVSDLCRGVTPVENWSSQNLHKIADALQMSMDEVYESCTGERR